MNNIFTYFYTIFFDMPRKTRLLWHPAGVAIAGVSREFRTAMRFGLVFATAYIVSLAGVLIWRREYLLNIQMSMILLWSLYVAVWYTIYIYHVTRFLKTHDINYVHPTSKVRTHARRSWAHVKHAMLPLLTGFLFLSIYFNIYRSWIAQPPVSAAMTKAAKVESVSSEVVAIPELVMYMIPLERGDSKTLIARKAIKIYLEKASISLTKKERLFAEDSLQKVLEDVPRYSKDREISVAEDSIKLTIEKTLEKFAILGQ